MSNMVYSSDNYEVEVNEKLYRCAVEAFATAVHEPGTMYRRNGDPGDPPVDEFDIDDLNVSSIVVVDDVGNEIPVTDENVCSEVESLVWDDLSYNEGVWTHIEAEPERDGD